MAVLSADDWKCLKTRRTSEHNGQVEPTLPRQVHLAVNIFCFLGLRDGARFSSSCAFVRTSVAGHPPTLETRVKLMQDLKLKFTWLGLESILGKISQTIPSYVRATVGTYCAALHSSGVIPHVGVEIIEAMQFHLLEQHRPNCCCVDRVWTLYGLEQEEHNHFEDFACACCPATRYSDMDVEVRRTVLFLDLLQGLWQCAVAPLDACSVCSGVDSLDPPTRRFEHNGDLHILDEERDGADSEDSRLALSVAAGASTSHRETSQAD